MNRITSLTMTRCTPLTFRVGDIMNFPNGQRFIVTKVNSATATTIMPLTWWRKVWYRLIGKMIQWKRGGA